MMEIFGQSESTIRLVVFLIIFGTMAAFELWSPRLEREELKGAMKSKRWLTNISILVLSSVLLRLVFPASAVGISLWAEATGFGLFNLISIPALSAALIAFVVLDFAVWLEHLFSHKWHWLWRIHRVHHSDTGFDVTTALRFHPLEILVSMVWKGSVVALLGAPFAAVLIFEIVLNGSAMFNHSNVKLPAKVDDMLRKFIVTPDMHRVHHSQNEKETNSNFGFNFSIWDRLFGTYIVEPSAGNTNLALGLKDYKNTDAANILWSLKLPFRK